MLNEHIKAPTGNDLYKLAMDVYTEGCKQYGENIKGLSKIYYIPVIENIITKLSCVYEFEGAEDIPYEDKEIDNAIKMALEISVISRYENEFKEFVKGTITNDTITPISIVLAIIVGYLTIMKK